VAYLRKKVKFYEGYFNPYLNFQRPCGFVTETKVDIKGRERKTVGFKFKNGESY